MPKVHTMTDVDGYVVPIYYHDGGFYAVLNPEKKSKYAQTRLTGDTLDKVKDQVTAWFKSRAVEKELVMVISLSTYSKVFPINARVCYRVARPAGPEGTARPMMRNYVWTEAIRYSDGYRSGTKAPSFFPEDRIITVLPYAEDVYKFITEVLPEWDTAYQKVITYMIQTLESDPGALIDRMMSASKVDAAEQRPGVHAFLNSDVAARVMELCEKK
jgi:hypothetical protein